MNSSTNDPTTPSTTNRAFVCDCSAFFLASIFVFNGIASLVQEQWIDAAGWLVFSLGLFIIIGSKPITQENWKKPRYLTCLALLVVGVSLLLAEPSHHPKASLPPGRATSNPAYKNI